jgi:hypothetical protein
MISGASAVQPTPDDEWNVLLLHENAEYHHLSKDILLSILQDEWGKEFNALFIGRDVDCVGRLGAVFLGDAAFVSYEEFATGRWLFSRGPDDPRSGGDRLVRLSPENAEDYSFPRRSLITKPEAWAAIRTYVASFQLTGLSE